MTASEVVSIHRYDFSSSDRLFFDANIWIYLYGPSRPGEKNVADYSSAFDRILHNRSRIYIDALILSEFVNRYARLMWQMKRSSLSDFKTFRATDEYKEISRDITLAVRKILRFSTRIETGFETLDLEAVLAQFAEGQSDFNDLLVAALCQRNGLKLVTHDADFKGKPISILTANPRLIR